MKKYNINGKAITEQLSKVQGRGVP